MAAAFLRHHGGDRVVVRSAGSAPAGTVNPAVVRVMAERGIDISGEQPKKLTTESVERSGFVVTMGCGDACPVVPGTRYLDWKLDDPAGRPAEEIRPVRDEIERRVQALLAELAGTATSETGTAAMVSAPSTRNAVE